MRYPAMFLIASVLVLFGCGLGDPQAAEPLEATPTEIRPTSTPDLEATVEARMEARLAEILDNTPTATPLPVPAPSATPQPTPTRTASPTPTSTAIPISTPVPSATATPVPSATPTPTSVPTSTTVPTSTPDPTALPKPSPTSIPTPTNVGGTLSADTVWSIENSPYVLVEPLRVPEGVSLEVKDGVLVDFNGSFMLIEGTLRVIGSANRRVAFKGEANPAGGNYLVFGPSATSWNEATGEGSIIVNAVFNLNTVIGDISIQVDGSAPLLKSIDVTNSRASGVYLGGPARLEDSRICDNFGWGVSVSDSAIVKGNAICNNREIGLRITGGSPEVTQNLIAGNNWLGVDFRGGLNIELQRVSGAPTIRNNTIIENLGYGIRVLGVRITDDLIIKGNTIAGNIEFDAVLGETPRDVNMTGNWWGTTDRDFIRESLYDEDFGFGLREITFLPLLTSAPDEAPPQP